MNLEIDGLSPLSIIDGFDQRGSRNLAPTEVTTIQSLHGVAGALHRAELDEDFGRVGVGIDVHNAAELPIAFGLDISKQIILPVAATLLLPIVWLVKCYQGTKRMVLTQPDRRHWSGQHSVSPAVPAASAAPP